MLLMFAYVISQIRCWILRCGGGLLYAYLSLHLVHFFEVLYCWGKNLQPHAALLKKNVLDCVIYLHFTVTPHSELRLPALYFTSSHRGSARHVLTLFPICCKYSYTEMS